MHDVFLDAIQLNGLVLVSRHSLCSAGSCLSFFCLCSAGSCLRVFPVSWLTHLQLPVSMVDPLAFSDFLGPRSYRQACCWTGQQPASAVAMLLRLAALAGALAILFLRFLGLPLFPEPVPCSICNGTVDLALLLAEFILRASMVYRCVFRRITGGVVQPNSVESFVKESTCTGDA